MMEERLKKNEGKWIQFADFAARFDETESGPRFTVCKGSKFFSGATLYLALKETKSESERAAHLEKLNARKAEREAILRAEKEAKQKASVAIEAVKSPDDLRKIFARNKIKPENVFTPDPFENFSWPKLRLNRGILADLRAFLEGLKK